MPSARRTRYIESKKRGKDVKKKKSFLRSLVKFLILPVILLLMYLFVLITSDDWDGKGRLALVYPAANNIEVTILDPGVHEITTIIIPGDTQVEVAANYGSLRLKNVWQLGINEKKYGNLLTKTVTKNFLFPVYLWSSSEASNLRSGNVAGLARFVFVPGNTNIKFGDRLNIAAFALKVKTIDKFEVDMQKSQFVKKATLSDGEPGFLPGPSYSRLGVYFSDSSLTGEGGVPAKIYILDRSGNVYATQKAGEILEVMGGKVVSVDRSQGVADLECEVKGKNKIALNKLSKIFGCEIIEGDTEFDVEVVVGKNFQKIF